MAAGMYYYCFVSIDFQNVSASWLFLFIAIKRQWCLRCILKFEGFAKTKGFLLRSDLLILNELISIVKYIEVYEEPLAAHKKPQAL